MLGSGCLVGSRVGTMPCPSIFPGMAVGMANGRARVAWGMLPSPGEGEIGVKPSGGIVELSEGVTDTSGWTGGHRGTLQHESRESVVSTQPVGSWS